MADANGPLPDGFDGFACAEKKRQIAPTLQRAPTTFGVILEGEYNGKYLDQLTGGALRRFYRKNLDPIDEADEEERRERDELLDDLLVNLCDPCFEHRVPVEKRYDAECGVYLAMYGALFIIVESVLVFDAVLVVAIGNSRDTLRVALDVLENGFPEHWCDKPNRFGYNPYRGHFPTSEILGAARAGFSRMKCDKIVTLEALPWRASEPRVKDFLRYAEAMPIMSFGRLCERMPERSAADARTLESINRRIKRRTGVSVNSDGSVAPSSSSRQAVPLRVSKRVRMERLAALTSPV